jgi:hypothetical protein
MFLVGKEIQFMVYKQIKFREPMISCSSLMAKSLARLFFFPPPHVSKGVGDLFFKKQRIKTKLVLKRERKETEAVDMLKKGYEENTMKPHQSFTIG